MRVIETHIVRVKEDDEDLENSNYLAKAYLLEGGTTLGENYEWVIEGRKHGLRKITQEKFMEYKRNTI